MNRCIWAFLISFFWTGIASAEKWHIIADEWPPYACAYCEEGGAAIKALKQALKSVNVQMEVTYFPWVKVLKEVKSKKYVGYFTWKESLSPGYLLPGKPLFSSPLVIVESVQNPLVWENLQDLRGKRIGVIEGSGYFAEFMDLARKGVIKAIPSYNDETRIRLVSQGKLDGALIDLQNALYYIRRMPQETQNKLRISKTVTIKETFFAVNEAYRDKLAILEKALKNVDTQKIVDDYIKNNLRDHPKGLR